jgi:hypothetical protein
LKDFFYNSKLFIINIVLDIVLGSVYSLREDIEDLIVFIIKAIAIYFEFCFDIRLLSIEVNLAFFFTYKLIRVVELCLVFRDISISG